MKVKKNQFIDNLKLDLKEALGSDEECFVEIRDVTIQEALRFKSNSSDESAQYEVLKELLPNLIVSHSFEDEEGKPLSNEEVSDFLLNSRWDIAVSVYEGILQWMFRSRLGRARGNSNGEIQGK